MYTRLLLPVLASLIVMRCLRSAVLIDRTSPILSPVAMAS